MDWPNNNKYIRINSKKGLKMIQFTKQVDYDDISRHHRWIRWSNRWFLSREQLKLKVDWLNKNIKQHELTTVLYCLCSKSNNIELKLLCCYCIRFFWQYWSICVHHCCVVKVFNFAIIITHDVVNSYVGLYLSCYRRNYYFLFILKPYKQLQ